MTKESKTGIDENWCLTTRAINGIESGPNYCKIRNRLETESLKIQQIMLYGLSAELAEQSVYLYVR
jgi:hypothetical protein